MRTLRRPIEYNAYVQKKTQTKKSKMLKTGKNMEYKTFDEEKNV